MLEINRHGIDGGLEFIDHVGKFAVWMQGEVPGAGTGFDFGEGRVVRRQRAFFGIEAVYQQLIEAQVGCNSEPVVGCDFDPVGVRAFLALVIGARAGMLHNRRRFSQMAIFQNWKNGDAAAGVVGHQDELSGSIERDVAGVGTVGGDFVEKGQLASFGIHGKRTDAAASLALVFVDLIHGIEEMPARVGGHERWIRGCRSQPERCHLAAGRIVIVGVNPFALACGVGADVGDVFGCGGRVGCKGGSCEYREHGCEDEGGDEVIVAHGFSTFHIAIAGSIHCNKQTAMAPKPR